jgi:membrane protein
MSKAGGVQTVSALRRAAAKFGQNSLTDWGAALAFFGLLAAFPGLLALVSLVGLFGDPEGTTEAIVEIVTSIGPESAAETYLGPIESITAHRSAAGLTLAIALAAALWSASAYVGAFIRASSTIYGAPGSLSFWRQRPLQLLVTLLMIVLVALVALGHLLSGPLVEAVAQPLGVSDAAVSAWDLVKWPLMAALFNTAIAILYQAAPAARSGGFRWVTPGSVLAIVAWVLASLGFTLYVAHFGSYDKTYGALGGAIVLLVWLWITNMAILFGHQLNAELDRGAAGGRARVSR